MMRFLEHPMPLIENIDGLRKYRDEKKPRVVLDTNILIKGCGRSEEKKMVKSLCAELDVCISDTVYWEFLRNTALDKFRERRAEIAKWKDGDFLREDAIIREDKDVTEMHTRLFLLLLKLNPKEPRRVLRLVEPDLWIAATAIQLKYDHILTTDVDDFPAELFERIATFKISDCTFYLIAFKRNIAKNLWLEMHENPEIRISCSSFFLKKSKT